jgi:hypothetical protein
MEPLAAHSRVEKTMKSMNGLCGAVAVAGVGFAAMVTMSAVAGIPTVEVLFKSSDLLTPPPGFPAGGVVWNSASTFSNPSIDDDGTVAFVGRIFDNDIDNPPLILAGGSGIFGNDRVFYYGEPGNWQNLAQGNTPDVLPGGPVGFTFNLSTGSNGLNTGQPSISGDGKVVISGTINYSGVLAATDTAMWSGAPGSIGFRAQEGSHAGDEVGDVNYSSSLSVSTPRFNKAGYYIFHSNLSGADVVSPGGGLTGSNMGLFIAGPTGVTTFARRSDPAPAYPGLPADTILNTQDSFGFLMNGSNHVVYSCRLANDVNPSALTTSDDRCLLADFGSGLEIIARENDAVPGMSGVQFAPNATGSPFTLPIQGLTNDDRLLFTTILVGRGVDSTNERIYFVRETDGSLTKVIRQGETATGLGSDTFLLFNNTAFMINNNGMFAGSASVTGPTESNEALLVGTVGETLQVVFREGDPVPGLTDVFFGAFISNTSLILNDADQILISTQLTGAGTTSNDNAALFTWDEANGLRMILRKGNSELLGGGEVINLITVAGSGRNAECGSVSFSNGGWVAVSFSTSLGSAIARFNVNDSEPTCPTDLDGDNVTSGSDLAVLLGAWGPGSGPADLDGNGEVDAADLAILLGGWGACP